MSYESRMLAEFAMPGRSKVQRALLRTLLKHGGVVKEFAAGEEVVGELADQFQLNSAQRTAALETLYRKENRPKKTLLWHRLLFRAADVLASDGLVSRPTQTSRLTGKREWMLTEEVSIKHCVFRRSRLLKRSRCRSNRSKSRKS